MERCRRTLESAMDENSFYSFAPSRLRGTHAWLSDADFYIKQLQLSMGRDEKVLRIFSGEMTAFDWRCLSVSVFTVCRHASLHVKSAPFLHLRPAVLSSSWELANIFRFWVPTVYVSVGHDRDSNSFLSSFCESAKESVTWTGFLCDIREVFQCKVERRLLL